VRRLLRRDFTEHAVLTLPGERSGDVYEEFLSESLAFKFLHELAHDDYNMQVLRDIFATETHRPDAIGVDDHEVLRQLAWHLVSGNVRITTSQLPRGAGAETGETESEEEEESAPPPPAPPGPQVSLACNFNKTNPKCGDDILLQAQATNIPDGASILFTLKSLADNKTIRTDSARLSGSRAEKSWRVQKPTDDWPTPEIDLAASGGGATAASSNKVTIYKYPDFAGETKTFACASGIYGWTGKFDIEFKAFEVRITIKIKLVNRLGPKPAAGGAMPAAGPSVSDADKSSMKQDIEGKLTEKWIMHRDDCQRGAGCSCPRGRGCCKFKVKTTVEFVEAGEHHVVNLFQGRGQANSGNWTRVKTRANSWAHETGHLLGWYDEYATGAVGTAPRWIANNPGAVMNTGLAVPRTYYWDFRDWIKTKTGEDWELI